MIKEWESHLTIPEHDDDDEETFTVNIFES
jgi:hypothetical protein